MPRFAHHGVRLSYRPDTVDVIARATEYVDRILRGEKAAVRHVKPLARIEPIINLRVAPALGLALTQNLLAHVDAIV